MSIAQQSPCLNNREFPVDAENKSENGSIGCRKATKKGVRMPLQDITNQFYAEFSFSDAENDGENLGGQENVLIAHDHVSRNV